MAAVRGDHDDNKSRIRTERAQERIKSHPFKRHGTKKKKGTAGPEASQSNCPREMDDPCRIQPRNLRKNENFNSIEVALYTMIVHLPCAALC